MQRLSQDLLVENLPVRIKKINTHVITSIVILNHIRENEMADDIKMYM